VLRAQEVYTNRTLRLAKVKDQGIEVAKELGLKNIRDLIPIINANEKHGIRFFRLSSCIFPFASEPEYGYSLQYAAKELKEAGDLAKKYGHRLTTHPGQYNVLCSPSESVVTKTFKDLAYHAEMLDLMGLGPDSVMIIHMGGAYGDKPKAIARFEENFMKLPPHVRNRLVLENDEISYTVEELLPVCKKLKIPLVLDWHHDRLNPSSKPIETYLPEIEAIWEERGIKPKQHYSESAKGHPNPRTHSDYISRLPPCAPGMDLMIEAKMKEQTVLRICRKYGISPDSKEYPTTDPQALSDDEEMEHKNVTLLGQARKKHTWKATKKSKEGELDENGEAKPKKKRQSKDATEAKKSKKVIKKAKGEAEETTPTTTVTKKKRKKAGSESDDEFDEDFTTTAGSNNNNNNKKGSTKKASKKILKPSKKLKNEVAKIEETVVEIAAEITTELVVENSKEAAKFSRKRKATAKDKRDKENNENVNVVVEIAAVQEHATKTLRRSPRNSIIEAQE